MARIRHFFVGACLAAAVLSVFESVHARRAARTPDANSAVATRSVSIEWPTHFRGRPLTQLAPAALDARFARHFPGAIARFSDGAQTLIVRRVAQPTRRLHPASDCFRAAGYAISTPRAWVDDSPHAARWRCFIATRGASRVRVCERIIDGHFESPQRAWTDVSAWYWSALREPGPWWAITAISPIFDGVTP